MVVHLLRELARELDRLDVRPEGAAEDALEEGLDLLLDCPEDHGAGGHYPRRGLCNASRYRIVLSARRATARP